MIELVSHVLVAIALVAGLFGLAVAAVWMIREDIGPDIDAMREARQRDRGAL